MFVVLCLLAAPAFSAAAVFAPVVGIVSAVAAWSFAMRRIAWLTALIAVAAPIELALLNGLSISGKVLLLLWACLLLIACGMLGSYLIEQQRAI